MLVKTFTLDKCLKTSFGVVQSLLYKQAEWLAKAFICPSFIEIWRQNLLKLVITSCKTMIPSTGLRHSSPISICFSIIFS